MQVAIQYARSKQVVTFAAAGNSYQDGNQPTYPAAYPEAVAVGAIDSNAAARALLEHRFLRRPRRAGRPHLVDVRPGPRAVRADERNVDGDAVRDRDRGARARREPELERRRPHPRRSSASATDLGAPGRDDTFGYGLINPRGALLAASPEKDRPGHQGSRLLDRDGRRTRARATAARGSTATSAARRSRRRSSRRPARPTARATGSSAPTARSTRSVTRGSAAVCRAGA